LLKLNYFTERMRLQGKKILLGITGSIAAYKSILLVRLLVKEGAEVKVVMTKAAEDFVSPLVLSTLSKNKVYGNLFEENSWANHVELGRWADLMVIAPLSCNTMAKMANGLCDNLLLAVYLSATCKVMIAPAMDEDMWKHTSTARNVATLQSYGNLILPVEKGELASGLNGEGRMAEPETILNHIENFFLLQNDFTGKKILITAGPTYEQIDPVRFIGNHSSGKMGIAIAEELVQRGAIVTLVLGPSAQPIHHQPAHLVRVKSAEEMYDACIERFRDCDVAIMSAAVADYTPAEIKDEKIKKADQSLTIQLKPTKDILGSLGKNKKQQLLVGFALETNNERENAIGKMQRKNADMIVLNSLKHEGAGFGVDTNQITIFKQNGEEIPFEQKTKKAAAKDIVDQIKTLFRA
jgi:phosphopantothenoylcysteine decarboxylase / phosphopantothenate---cysteine ligase